MTDRRIVKMHAMMKRQHKLGLITDESMKEADALLAEAKQEKKVAMTGEQIRALRTREHLSQGQLAKRLYISPNSVQKWERGVTQPKGAALAMLELIDKKGVAALEL
ncbi:helix-turn-helix domain-containing protein [Enterobacter soli]|uniref:helix-turn-helix domain-containing protein n=1 Tax=Enterobacter soli TaxID=885040 RepID=UPI002F41A499